MHPPSVQRTYLLFMLKRIGTDIIIIKEYDIRRRIKMWKCVMVFYTQIDCAWFFLCENVSYSPSILNEKLVLKMFKLGQIDSKLAKNT